MVMKKYMQKINIRPHLWLQQTINGNYIKPSAPYVMRLREGVFLQVF